MNWVQLLEDHNIDFVTRGPNTKRGEVSICCPYCGEDDPSQHLGISLTTENWGCHRDATHRGKSAPKLVTALLNCSFAQAKLVVRQYSTPDPSNLDEALAMLEQTEATPEADSGPKQVEFPPEFEPIRKGYFTNKFPRYLEGRGFLKYEWLAERFNLRCCLTGRWKNRIIIPYYQAGQLTGWTGRSIEERPEAPRYLSSSDTIKSTIFDEALTLRGKANDILAIVEGPFDAMKLIYWGAPSIQATCCFGTSWSIPQICLLNAASKRYRSNLVMFDMDAISQVWEAQNWIKGNDRNVHVRSPFPWKDPGEMDYSAVQNIVKVFSTRRRM